jgi:hypothetical protein
MQDCLMELIIYSTMASMNFGSGSVGLYLSIGEELSELLEAVAPQMLQVIRQGRDGQPREERDK